MTPPSVFFFYIKICCDFKKKWRCVRSNFRFDSTVFENNLKIDNNDWLEERQSRVSWCVFV